MSITVDETDAYWSTGALESIRKCSLAGCDGSPTLVMSGPPVTASTRIALDGQNVYFASAQILAFGGVFACAKSGCDGQPTALATGLTNPSGLATDGENVYWLEVENTNGAARTGSVKKCAVAGCGNQPIVIASGLNGPAALALDTTYVYWAEYGTGADDGRIVRAPK